MKYLEKMILNVDLKITNVLVELKKMKNLPHNLGTLHIGKVSNGWYTTWKELSTHAYVSKGKRASKKALLI